MRSAPSWSRRIGWSGAGAISRGRWSSCIAAWRPMDFSRAADNRRGSQGEACMSEASNTRAPTQSIKTGLETYAYRRFGAGAGPPLVFLQHFTGTLDNWDPAVTDPLARGREVILFDNAGVGRSTGRVANTVQEMAAHVLGFLESLGVTICDVLGFSLGG